MKRVSRVRNAMAAMPVGRQLFAAFALVLTLTAVVGAVAIWSLNRVEAQSQALSEKWLKGVGNLAEARSAVVEMREQEVKHSRTDDSSYHKEYEDKINEASQRAVAALSSYERLSADDEERGAYAKLAKRWAEFQKSNARVLALGREKKQQDAAEVSDGLAAMAFDEMVNGLNAQSKYNFEGGAAAAQRAHQLHSRASTAMMALLAVALCLGVLMAVVITRRLLGQLGGEPRVAVQVARAVASGDLTTPISLKAGDEHSLMAALRDMQQGLSDAVVKVRLGSQNVAGASVQIAQGNQDLSTRTEQQAGALQQTASTMDQLGGTVRNNADNARQANELSQGASAVAVKGGEVVSQVVQTMRGINESSRKISEIIGVIDGIAFQTNILALNAAVEAARAGEQGRGFAVVAGEVRTLAQRSAEAAKEIKSLISASVERVERGTTLVDEAGRTMDEIVGAIQRVSSIVGEISNASAEQSAGVAQVGQAVSQMEHSTQQNAALVEQSASAAESLKAQASELVEAMAVFKVQTPA